MELPKDIRHDRFYIAYNENTAMDGDWAYRVYYRTERHAIKGAERLYHREHGYFENIFDIS